MPGTSWSLRPGGYRFGDLVSVRVTGMAAGTLTA
jgi:hypothetical protein